VARVFDLRKAHPVKISARDLKPGVEPPKHVSVETATKSNSLQKSAPALARHLAFVRESAARTALRTGIAIAFPVIVGWLSFVIPLDWFVELPRWSRALFFLTALGVGGVVAWRGGLRQWMSRPSDDEIALRIEKALPGFRTRFIASIQLGRERDDALVRALIKETTQFAEHAPLCEVVDSSRLNYWRTVSIVLLLLGVASLQLVGPASIPLLKRALCVEVPVPRNTSIQNHTGSRVIALGDDLRIEATAGGEIPKSGKLRMTTFNGRQIDYSLDAQKPGDRFARLLQSIQESFYYTLELGDNRTAKAKIEVRNRPTITKVEAAQIWPDYTQLPPRPRAMSDLKILAGSKLTFRLKSSSPLKSAALRYIGPDRREVVLELPMSGATPVDWQISAPMPKKDATGVTFHLVDMAGIESKSATTYRLEIIPDEPPSIRILWPARREELVTRNATMLVSFEAKDDYGISKVRLHYGVNFTSATPHKSVDLELEEGVAKSIVRRFEWQLPRLSLNEGDIVDFWLEAIDNNTATGPSTGAMADHYQARVVSDAEKRADLATRLDDTIRGLNSIKQNQEQLSQQLGELIPMLPGQIPAPR
jgi:hypothetical protein